MKKLLFLFLSVLVFSGLNAQQTYIINQGVGFTFDPSNISVNQGDIIHFNLSAPHQPGQVSQATWNANGNTLLPGGFSFPSGSGDYTTTTPGTIYYVCTVHADLGMKGTIVVNAVTGINDIQKNSGGKVFPNPATEFITYQTKETSTVHEVRILDFSGKTIKILQNPLVTDDQVKIDIGNLNKGLYFIIVRSDDGIESVKFLKS
ncbi:MAG TPA: T9SS type A sorting domain-containing protein [Bacteroidales bacterium]